jgi:hypothetical protein
MHVFHALGIAFAGKAIAELMNLPGVTLAK